MKNDTFDDLSDVQKKAAELYVRNVIEYKTDADNEVTLLKDKEIAEEVGVDRTTYYRWNKDPRFLEYVIYLSLQQARKHVPMFIATLVSNQMGKNPSTKQLDLYAKVVGLLGDSSQGDSSPVSVTFNLTDAQQRVKELRESNVVPNHTSERQITTSGGDSDVE
ncbi:phBC6A51 family helix-turn-helix protein [Abyssicoccus albus]|uniref:Putative insertion element HTH domain-containing protein n=1 Tax=Abyssicoccus albus TaxID=1817405 RepID=A0A3N5BB50_9BACL|nr:phBC6A51 family helix-turn-helix protein [Abyssicoccus albus]RPF54744.1 putative insertion element HTH domain-containing protein [Abyssicoccus albus]